MATFTSAAAQRPDQIRGDALSGALLASGAAALFVGTLFYARLTPRLGLPALPAERAGALCEVHETVRRDESNLANRTLHGQ